MPLHHRIIAPPHHRVTVSVSHLPCPLPPNQSVICLVPYHCVTASLCHHVTASLHHRATMSPCHHVSQSFALPPATKPVSHLPCPLPPNQSVICLAPYHRILHHHITVLVSHLPCPLPPSQSVIYLAPCHQASQSFALSPATKPVSHLPCPLPPCYHIIASPRHRITTSPH